MKPMTLETIARITGGTLMGGSPETLANGVVRDNRQVKPGNLFLCIPGARVDGHDFAPAAFKAGASACLAQRPLPEAGGPVIVVEDTLKALRLLGKYYRSRLTIPVIGVIGSVGKTTAKEMTAAALSARFRVFKTDANLNNDIGVPLSLLSIEEEHQVAVIEMGISDFGEMSVLADMARPDICIMTTIGHCHLENLKDLDGVLKAKSEVIPYMPANGTLIVNGDDEKLASLSPAITKLTFGLGDTNDWIARDVQTDGTSGVSCSLSHGGDTFPVYIPAFGSHMVLGALPAAAVAALLGESPEEIAKGLLTYAAVGGRANIEDTGFIRVSNDCYNANPNSMKASLTSLSMLPGRRVAILGDMKELGPTSPELHRQVGALVGQLGLELLLTAGPEAKAIAQGCREGGFSTAVHAFPTKAELLEQLPALIRKDDTVLVKASHSMGFDEVVSALGTLK